MEEDRRNERVRQISSGVSKYSGRKTRRGSGGGRRVKETKGLGIRPLAIKLIACVLILGTTGIIKYALPGRVEGFETFMRQNVAGGIDYRAVFSAFGGALAGEGKITDVFKDIASGSFDSSYKSASGGLPASASEADAPVSGDVTIPLSEAGAAEREGIFNRDMLNDKFTYNASQQSGLITSLDRETKLEYQKLGRTMQYLSVSSEDKSNEFDEIVLPLPGEKDENGNAAPSNVSYEYYDIDFEYMLPVDGTLTSKFGYRIHPISKKLSFHYGLDIGADSGTVISAFAAGTVEAVGVDSIYGNYVFLRHKDGIITFYGHCKKILVEEGQLIQMGDPVAQVGNTGYSTGPHLHFEVRSGTTNLDPAHYVTPSK
ncbi:MAG: M23 family metallopeptidase [Oscillospiraceae bacterium]|jgi:murein DD-endopeptidase MepM/ murein hydrolase activator NlpD|nr:M23 family metallopeptidase [Oscillospiraceae bacterium]